MDPMVSTIVKDCSIHLHRILRTNKNNSGSRLEPKQDFFLFLPLLGLLHFVVNKSYTRAIYTKIN